MSAETVRKVLGVTPPDVPTYLALTEIGNAETLTNRQAVRLIELYGNVPSLYENLSDAASLQIGKTLLASECRIREALWPQPVQACLTLIPCPHLDRASIPAFTITSRINNDR